MHEINYEEFDDEVEYFLDGSLDQNDLGRNLDAQGVKVLEMEKEDGNIVVQILESQQEIFEDTIREEYGSEEYDSGTGKLFLPLSGDVPRTDFAADGGTAYLSDD